MKILLLVFLVVLVATMAQAQKRRKTPVRPLRREPYRARADSECTGGPYFELITGFVYSSADDIIDSKIGTLVIDDCISHCAESEDCQALNFETGLCVLFRTAAGDESGECVS